MRVRLGDVPVHKPFHLAPELLAAAVAERSEFDAGGIQGWKSHEDRVAALPSRDAGDCDAATRLLPVSARDRGLRCAPPAATQVKPLCGSF